MNEERYIHYIIDKTCDETIISDKNIISVRDGLVPEIGKAVRMYDMQTGKFKTYHVRKVSITINYSQGLGQEDIVVTLYE